MLRIVSAVLGVAVSFSTVLSSAAQDLASLYSAQAIVTGTGEVNRQLGFKICLDQVLVRVSGDQRLLARPQMAELRERAGSFVDAFRYRDRLEGIPVHDEQGTHDRPHDLTCLYKPEVLDGVLHELGGKPWLAERPVLAIFMVARNGGKAFALASDGQNGPYMRDSFQAAAGPLAMRILFPDTALLTTEGATQDTLADIDIAALDKAAKQAGADQALAGSIVWSDKDRGWVADWRLAAGGQTYRWQISGVSFDDAFRNAMRGAAQILSGNGQP